MQVTKLSKPQEQEHEFNHVNQIDNDHYAKSTAFIVTCFW